MGKRIGRIAAIAAAALLVAAALVFFQLSRDPLGDAPKLALVADDGWPRLPAGVHMGQATGLTADAKGRIFVFHRAGREWVEPFPKDPIAGDTVFVFDGARGNLLARWGAGEFIMPHGLAIDREGNVWVTDVGAQQVRKFTADGRPLLTLGERGVKGSDAGHFALPTDIAFGPDGIVYVTDGYENTRVVRFTPDGRYLGEWGKPGKAPGQFDLPHGIAISGDGRVFVADRENSRLQIFDPSGKLLDVWKDDRVGRPYGVDLAPDGSIFVADGGNQPWPTRSRLIHLTAKGRLLGALETREPSDKWVLAHALTVAPDGTVYLADAWANRVRRLVPQTAGQ
jgi:peptidylamidoglycolate lyase